MSITLINIVGDLRKACLCLQASEYLIIPPLPFPSFSFKGTPPKKRIPFRPQILEHNVENSSHNLHFTVQTNT